MSVKKTIIVVGSSYGGLIAASKARLTEENARIILLSESSTLDALGIEDHVNCDGSLCHARRQEWDETFAKKFNIEIKRECRVFYLDIDTHCLAIDSKGIEERISYDALIWAMPSVNQNIDIKLDGPRAVHFATHEDMVLIKEAIKSHAKQAVVIGCGSRGILAAQYLKNFGLNVVIIEAKKRIMSRFSLEFASSMLRKLNEMGITVILGQEIIKALRPADDLFTFTLSDGQTINCDLVVTCIGTRPKNDVLVEAGVALDADGFIRVDEHLRTTLPMIWACENSIRIPLTVDGLSSKINERAALHRCAEVAGFNAASFGPAFDVIKPFSGTQIFSIGDFYFARTGLSESESRRLLGDDNILVSSISCYLRDRQEQSIRLIIHRQTCAIKGGEIAGVGDVKRSIDVLAMAVHAKLTLDHLIDVDFSCAKYLDATEGDPLREACLKAKAGLLQNTQFMSSETLALWLKNEKDFRLIDVDQVPKLSSYLRKKNIHHVPLESLRERVNEFSTQTSPIVLYSESNQRSFLAEQALIQRGMNNVYHLEGGIATWDLIIKKE